MPNNNAFFGGMGGMGEELAVTKTDAEVAAFDAAQAAAPQADEGLLSRIISGVKSIVGSDTLKQLAPSVGALVASKITKQPEPAKTKKAAKTSAAAPTATPTTPMLAQRAQAGMPGWVVPVALAGVALVGGWFFLRRRKK